MRMQNGPRLLRVAVAPRRTMREILDSPVRKGSVAVVIAASVSYALRDLKIPEMRKAAESLGIAGSLLVGLGVVVALVITSLIFYYVVSAAATFAGRAILGGSGNYANVRKAVAWGLAPQVWGVFFRLLAIAFWPEAVALLQGTQPAFRMGDIEFTPIFGAVPFHETLIVGLGELAIFIWYLIVGGQTLAEAHGFSSLRGVANLILAVVLPFVILLILAAAFALTMWTT
jgi:hypothetical protein